MSNRNNIPNLNPSSFIEQFRNNPNAELIDVRTPTEVAGGRIPGARSIDFQNYGFRKEIEQLDKTKTYFVYCRSGNRSMNACIAMQAIGIEDVINLNGGYQTYKRTIS